MVRSRRTLRGTRGNEEHRAGGWASPEVRAKANGFHKIVLFTLPFNTSGQALYRKFRYREVGVFEQQGQLDGAYVNVMAMEKIL